MLPHKPRFWISSVHSVHLPLGYDLGPEVTISSGLPKHLSLGHTTTIISFNIYVMGHLNRTIPRSISVAQKVDGGATCLLELIDTQVICAEPFPMIWAVFIAAV